MMQALMDSLPAKRFLLHTNGTMLDRVPPEYLKRLHTISVSIDGDRATTDYYRGEGVYDRITTNARTARAHGFSREMIARMTVTEDTDIFRQVTHLLDNPDFAFDSVHWQLNALFWRNDRSRRHFARWARESYNPGITRLVREWVRVMREDGRVLMLYPFVDVAQSLLKGEKTLLRCGAGWAEYNVQTDGNISPCPVMSGMKDFYAGDIRGSPAELKRVPIGGIAHAGARGISKVEVQMDDGSWEPAALRTPLSPTTWVIWRYEWPFQPGKHTFAVRCFERDGTPQIATPSPAEPNGATGIHNKSMMF
jgi:putative peptide-modifying radical SAM enzyme